MKKLTYLLLCLFFVGIGLANAQTRTVTGTVISAEDGEPVIGASVIVKGTTTGTVTDFDGAFNLEVPSLEGDAAIIEIGVTMKPGQNSPWSMDVGAKGYAGDREGLTGSVLVRYAF